ncbi:MAG: molybdenum cofactor guanylyltransferase [Thiothrix sp.]|nr:MAG: molybdenum cofactor guanylyltransferase [Thiothrix sp.]
MIITGKDITGVILAGGKGRRMGGQDKGLVEYRQRPLIEHVIERLAPQVGHLLINANRNAATYQRYGFPIIADQLADYQGPLAGFSVAMLAAKTDYVLTAPCDGPLLPYDLVSRMVKTMNLEKAEISVAHDDQHLQSVYALIKRDLLPSLEACIQSGQRRVDVWYASQKTALTDFSDTPESFFNVNFPEDRDEI